MREVFFRKIRFVIAVLFFFTNFAAGKQQDGLSLAPSGVGGKSGQRRVPCRLTAGKQRCLSNVTENDRQSCRTPVRAAGKGEKARQELTAHVAIRRGCTSHGL